MGVCKENSCKTQGVFDMVGGKGSYCMKHKQEGMVNVMRKHCEDPMCTSQPTFNIEGGKGRFCAKHKLGGMVNVMSKCCEDPACTSRNPIFNVEGGKGRFCVKHRLEGMVNVGNKRCEYPACTSLSHVFNVEGGKGRFCVKHKLKGMVNVRNKRCEDPACTSQPSFDLEGGKGRFCVKHKLEGMLNVVSKRCEDPICTSQPNFDLEGGKGRFCVKHRLEGMTDISSKRCGDPACTSLTPVFNFQGGKGRFCLKHKLEGMVNVRDKQCLKCKAQAWYGMPANPPISCAAHKEPGMIKHPTQRCSASSCNNTGTHEHNNSRFCEEHAPADALNLALKICTSCNLMDILNHDSLCSSCDPVRIERAKHAKELYVKGILDSNGVAYESHDRKIDRGACVDYRPDFLIDAGTHIVVLEVDENQHKSYPCTCEQQRMVNISQAIGMPTLFLRYNPDSYKVGRRVVKGADGERRKVLLEWIKWASSPEYAPQESNALCIALYLFYDEFDPTKVERNIVTALETMS